MDRLCYDPSESEGCMMNSSTIGTVIRRQREALQLQALDDASARTPELTA